MTLTVPGTLTHLTDADLPEFLELHPDITAVKCEGTPEITFYGFVAGVDTLKVKLKIIAIHKQEKANRMTRTEKRFRREHRHRTPPPADTLMLHDGKRMAIIRPLDPALALRLVSEIADGTPHEESIRRFDDILTAQPYRFIGLAAHPQGNSPPWILHPETRKRIGKVEPGDSFVDYDTMAQGFVKIDDPTKTS